MNQSDALTLVERVNLALRLGESHYREFKSALHGAPGSKTPRAVDEVRQDVGRTLVAFANADGGELLVGVEDDATVTGVPYDQRAIERILNAPSDMILSETPLVGVRKTTVETGGKKIIYFSVQKGASYIHLTSDGRCLKRVDRESVPQQVEHLQAQKIEDDSRYWERQFATTATIGDLDIDLINTISTQVSYGVSAEKYLQLKELADFTAEGIKINRAALLLFAKDIRRWYPSFGVRILVYSSNTAGAGPNYNAVYEDRASENILRLIEVAWERLYIALIKSIEFKTSATKFVNTSLFPQIACREALVNAIVHRNYAIEGRGIEIFIFPDRMEIQSPGMLLSTISLSDIQSGSGVHESRNPLIARVLKESGYVREIGEGIRRIKEAMRNNALKEPEFSNQPKGFSVCLFSKPIYSEEVMVWLSNFESYTLTTEQIAVVSLGFRNREFSTHDIMERLGIVDTGAIPQIITYLRSKSILVRTKDHSAAINEAKRRKIPKKSVKCYKIEIPSKREENTISSKDEIRFEVGEMIAPQFTMHIQNIGFHVTKESLAEFLAKEVTVEAIDLPTYRHDLSKNRGFAHVIASGPRNPTETVRRLNGSEFEGRKLTVNLVDA